MSKPFDYWEGEKLKESIDAATNLEELKEVLDRLVGLLSGGIQ